MREREGEREREKKECDVLKNWSQFLIFQSTKWADNILI
jgi:hypothetical protein